MLERILATQWSSDLRGRGDLFSLLGTRLRAIALFHDGWTFGLSPAGIVVDNGDPSPLRQKITLDVGDTRRELPVRVFIDDGERVETIRFEQAQPRTIELAPVAPFTTRLFIVWSDTAWTPSQRQLGVWIQVARQP